MESRPFLVESKDALAAWLAGPKSQAQLEPMMEQKAVSEKERQENNDDKVWICAKCKTMNKERIKTCQGCGVTKQWSDAKNAKKK